MFEKALFGLSVSAGGTKYSLSAEFSADTFSRNHLWSDTILHGQLFACQQTHCAEMVMNCQKRWIECD
jgi:hypothetical protein